MEGGMISAQQFEVGACGFARLWEACSDAEQLWTWVPPGNKLVSQLISTSFSMGRPDALCSPAD